MHIRPHRPADYRAIATLRWQLKAEESSQASEGQKQAFLRRYQRHLQESEKDGRTVHWVIDDGDTIVGVMTVRIVPKEPSPVEDSAAWGYLTNSFVTPAHRNRGLGTRLIEAIKAWAKDSGLELLIVWPSDASYRFYRRAGFKGRDDPLELILDPEA